MAFERDVKSERLRCGIFFCQTKAERDELEYVLIEKEKELHKLRSIINQIETIEVNREEIMAIFYEVLNNIHPFYSYLKNKAKSINGLNTILVKKEEEIFDIWFILDRSISSLEKKASTLFCNLVQEFNTLDFNILILSKENEEIIDLVEDGFKLIYNRD